MHIAIVNQHPADMLGGSEIQCDIIARGLAQRGHQIDYVAVAGKTDRDYRTSYSVHAAHRDADAIADLILSLSPQIVYWRFNKHCFAKAARRIHEAGIRIVFSVSHVRDVSRFYLQPGAWQLGGFKALRRALKESSRLYREHQGFTYVDALVSNNPDNLNRVAVSVQLHIPNSMITTMEEFHWPRPYCLWVANIKDRKQPEKFVELATRLQGSGIDFLMVGQLQSKTYGHLLSAGPENFHYLGEKRLEEVNGMLASSLFLVHTCHPEGFSNNFIQAWLQGRTVVSLAFDPGHLLETEGLGFYSAGNMETFIEQTRRLIENPALARQMGGHAQTYAIAHFSPETNVGRLENLLSNILHPGRKNASAS